MNFFCRKDAEGKITSKSGGIMKIDSTAQTAAAQMNTVQNKSVKAEEKTQPASTQNYDKVSLSDSAKALMSSSKPSAE